MGDVFIESMVKKGLDGLGLLKIIGIVLAALIVSVAAFYVGMFILPQMGMFSALIACGACYGAYLLIQTQLIEFETIVTNGSMDVDKIMARSRRKRLFSVDCKNAEAFFRYNEGVNMSKYPRIIWACDSRQSPDLWCITAKKEKGLTAVVFNAPDKVLGAIRPYLPRQIMITVPRPGETA